VIPVAANERAARPADARRSDDAEPGGQIGDRIQFNHIFVVVVDTFEVPCQMIRHVDGVRPDRHHRKHVAAHRIADHAEAIRRDTKTREQLRVDPGVLLKDDLNVGEVVLQPGRCDLARLMDEVALRDQDQPCVCADAVGVRAR